MLLSSRKHPIAANPSRTCSAVLHVGTIRARRAALLLLYGWSALCRSVVVPEAQHRPRGGVAEAGRQQQDLGRVSASPTVSPCLPAMCRFLARILGCHGWSAGSCAGRSPEHEPSMSRCYVLLRHCALAVKRCIHFLHADVAVWGCTAANLSITWVCRPACSPA